LDGKLKVGDLLPPYTEFIEELNKRGVKYKKQEVDDFLAICNLLKITDMSGRDGNNEKVFKVVKDYDIARGIFKIVS
jgi:hypothetical protein